MNRCQSLSIKLLTTASVETWTLDSLFQRLSYSYFILRDVPGAVSLLPAISFNFSSCKLLPNFCFALRCREIVYTHCHLFLASTCCNVKPQTDMVHCSVGGGRS